MIKLEKIILANKTEVLQGEASNLVVPMGAQLNRPTGVKAAKKHNFEIKNKQSQVHKANMSLKQMAALHIKMASVMAQKSCSWKSKVKLQVFGNSKNTIHREMIWLEWLELDKIEKLTKMLSDDKGGIKNNESDDLGGTIPPGEDHCKSDGSKEGNAEVEEDDDEEYTSNDDKDDDFDNGGKVGDMGEVNVDYDNKEGGDDKLDNKVEVHVIDEGVGGDVDTEPILNNMA